MNLLTVKKYLFKRSLTKFQEIQLKYIDSILQEILAPILCNYKNIDVIKSQITDIESFYFGFKPNPSLISEKLVLPLYISNRFFIASSGPRFGSIYEDLIKSFLENFGYQVDVRVNIFNYAIFRDYHQKSVLNNKKVIDFIARKDNKLYLIEQRTSEHTGGRTGQESLLDKFKVFLDWIIEKSADPLINKGIREIYLVIFISYSEKHEILTEQNVSKGRINSLIAYIVENLGDYFTRLITKGFKTKCTDLTSCLKQYRRLIFYTDQIKIEFRIMLGEEFYEEILGEKYSSLKDRIIKEELGDDLWVIYSILPYELRMYYEEGFMWSNRIYEMLVSRYEHIITSASTEDDIINKLASKIIEDYKDLRLLETNDLSKQYEYLKTLCAASLILYALKCPSKLVL
ncbi:MAG: hypothetical protein JHC26_12055 [Thermofilum sp.]|uniref:hypothetical protein n=1 Tax=Thermofilum sp. TaxID=1961369 RepID=UPI00258F5A0F|nr:hypothetical protein [Thermofilum sp.]MCI4409818.1 hypothetical protein [Thermofilum sp.]